MDRESAAALVKEWVQGESLRRHLRTVEEAMRAMAASRGLPASAPPGQDSVEGWGTVGLLHDFDFEKYPTKEDHPFKGVEELRRRGFPENWCRAILGDAEYSGVPRDSDLAKMLFACDELCGFLTAVALVRPSKKIAEVEVRSVIKKLKDKAFARNVSREEIEKGIAELGVEREAHIGAVLKALQESAPRWEGVPPL
ncbi:MAG: HAD family hydrolase [Planctomycetota bacterium]|nr:HAD family hydrolase [Planctomycetota bacterium]